MALQIFIEFMIAKLQKNIAFMLLNILIFFYNWNIKTKLEKKLKEGSL